MISTIRSNSEGQTGCDIWILELYLVLVAEVHFRDVADEHHVVHTCQLQVVRGPVRLPAQGLEGEPGRAPPRHLRRHPQDVPVHRQLHRPLQLHLELCTGGCALNRRQGGEELQVPVVVASVGPSVDGVVVYILFHKTYYEFVSKL